MSSPSESSCGRRASRENDPAVVVDIAGVGFRYGVRPARIIPQSPSVSKVAADPLDHSHQVREIPKSRGARETVTIEAGLDGHLVV